MHAHIGASYDGLRKQGEAALTGCRALGRAYALDRPLHMIFLETPRAMHVIVGLLGVFTVTMSIDVSRHRRRKPE
jgi:hypothetical protein